MIAFVFYFSALGAILCASLFVPMLIAFGFEEIEVGNRIILYGILGGFICSATLLAIRGRLEGMGRNTAIILAVAGWLGFPVITALPIMDVAELGYVDALFQTMAAFTTSGSLVFGNLEVVPKSVIFLLAQFQWLGGIATLITVILVLAPWEVGGLPPVGSASVAASIVASHSRLIRFCWRLFRAYLLLTLICFIALLLNGVPPYEAIILSFGALSTGGIVPSDQNLDILLGSSGMMIMACFMMIGATSIFWHENLAQAKVEELAAHRESYFILAAWGVFGFFIAYFVARAAGAGGLFGDANTVSEGFFNSASIISTTAFQSRPGIFSLIPATLVLLIVFVGAGCYSTSGGLKFYRIGGMFSLSEYELNRLIYPSSVKRSRFGNTKFDLEIMKAIWSLFAVLIAAVAIGTCLFSFSGMSFHASYTAVIAAISNAGTIYTPEWINSSQEAWPTYVEMNAIQKLLLAIMMFIGRLEVIAVVACGTVLFRSFR